MNSTGFVNITVDTNSSSNATANKNMTTRFQEAWKGRKFREAIGLSRDGRPIYSPYFSDGKKYCDVDVCNGRVINGEYAYVATDYFPYIMGCFGPGEEDSLKYKVSCSGNLKSADCQEGKSLLE